MVSYHSAISDWSYQRVELAFVCVGMVADFDYFGASAGQRDACWEAFASALSRAFQFGADQAKEYVDAAVKAANDLVASAGKRARAVQQELLKRVQVYLSQLVDAAIAQVRSTVMIGVQTLALESVDMSYEISLGGSLKVTITDLASLTSAGELTVSARYTIAGGDLGF